MDFSTTTQKRDCMNLKKFSPSRHWRNLSVSYKLYAVVGLMAVLIAVELGTLVFAMRMLSSMRGFVVGEGIWSKAQKSAVLELQNYAWTHDPSHLAKFHEHLKIPMGDYAVRIEMQKPEMDLEAVKRGMLEGKTHPDDILPMVHLIRRFHDDPYIKNSLRLWADADYLIFQLVAVSEKLNTAILETKGPEQKIEIAKLLEDIFKIDRELTVLENEFSSSLSQGSRDLERMLTVLLFLAVVAVEGTGLALTVILGRSLDRSLKELRSFAIEVGEGNFAHTVEVRSNDEIGQLAGALNKMALDLKELNSEKRIAEGANHIKNLFLANMSHEIRTPLNAILGFIELLGEHNLSRQDRMRFVEIVERAGRGLATIVDDILDISMVEAGKLEVHKVLCSPHEIITDIQNVLSLRAEQKGLHLVINQENLPRSIVTDVIRYKQILVNIIGNAIKFTNHGEVMVTFEHIDSNLMCRVRDTGPGIDMKDFDKLFQPFSQVDLSIRKRFGGTGLGLVLSRRLAQLLGGNVKLEKSVLGEGSVFVVSISTATDIGEGTLDTKALNLLVPNKRPMQALRGRRILVVEDALDNQILVKQFLERDGARVDIVENGQLAVEAVSKSRYDLILMDMQMPVMDGYTATRQIRNMGYKVPIVALTAHAMREDLAKCIEAGCNEAITKPFQRHQLIEQIKRYGKTFALTYDYEFKKV